MFILKIALSFLAIGAGVIQLATSMGLPALPSILLILFGLTQLLWGVYNLITEHVRYVKLMMVLTPIIMLSWFGIVLFSQKMFSIEVPLVPILSSTALNFILALGLGYVIRKGEPDLVLSPAKLLASLFIIALSVSAITTPALAATEAGKNAKPHGQFHAPVHPGHK